MAGKFPAKAQSFRFRPLRDFPSRENGIAERPQTLRYAEKKSFR